jgi:uncharacterized integral membrane protein (TIGR00698 family)
MGKIAPIALGILVCFAIAIPAWWLGTDFSIIGGPIFAILLGIMIRAGYPNILTRFNAGIKFTSKTLLQLAIILLGFGMNLFLVFQVGSQSLFIMVFTLSTAFLTAFLVGKALKINGKTTTLIGVGTSICGASAIACTAPIVNAEDSDMAHAISTIFLFNIIAVFIFPALGHLMGMNDIGFGMWAGTAINDTSSVVAAAASWSASVGNNVALAFATIVKLTRTLMIVPITFVLALFTSRKSTTGIGGSSFHFVKVFPWFIAGFVLAAVVNTFSGLPTVTSGLLSQIGTFMIVMAMAAIGLNTNLRSLLSNGRKPIFLGLCCWFSVASVSVLVQILMHIW